MNALSPPVKGKIMPLLFLYKNSFGIKWPTKVDMPLNKKIKLDYDLVLPTWRCILSGDKLVSQRFCNILVVYASFLCKYHMTQADQAVTGIISSW